VGLDVAGGALLSGAAAEAAANLYSEVAEVRKGALTVKVGVGWHG